MLTRRDDTSALHRLTRRLHGFARAKPIGGTKGVFALLAYDPCVGASTSPLPFRNEAADGRDNAAKRVGPLLEEGALYRRAFRRPAARTAGPTHLVQSPVEAGRSGLNSMDWRNRQSYTRPRVLTRKPDLPCMRHQRCTRG